MATLQARANTARARSAFTLIELLVVIGIIALLIALLVPALSGAYSRARATATEAQLKNISVACETYYSDFGAYPGVMSESALSDLDSPIMGAQNLVISLMMHWQPYTGTTPAGWIHVTAFPPFDVDPDLTRRPTRYDGTPREYGPYITPKVSELTTGLNNPSAYIQGSFPVPLNGPGAIPAFVDSSFKSAAMPILYYRATSNIAPGNTGGPQTATSLKYGGPANTATYYSLTNSEIRDATNNNLLQGQAGVDDTPFAKAVCDPNPALGSNVYNVPKGGFVLLSAGIDRKYGTTDDITISGGH